MKTIIVAGNGPSAQSEAVRDLVVDQDDRVFRCNYFFLAPDDALGYVVDDWFICEAVEDCRAVRAAVQFGKIRPTIWVPGLSMEMVNEIETNHLTGLQIRVQKTFAQLPAATRWENDLAPYRPLMGSFALAVAVGMRPEKIVLCGHDLFLHPSKKTHGGLSKETRPWQTDFNKAYIENRHRNHQLRGDLKYIRAALDAYDGEVVSIGSVLAHYFAADFPSWTWLDG